MPARTLPSGLAVPLSLFNFTHL